MVATVQGIEGNYKYSHYKILAPSVKQYNVFEVRLELVAMYIVNTRLDKLFKSIIYML
jgi:hypothetical protein